MTFFLIINFLEIPAKVYNHISLETNENTKPLKGILKTNSPHVEISKNEPRKIDPNLIYLLKDFKLNQTTYSREKKEMLLKPYRDSGELDYLMKNREVLEALLKNTPSLNQQPQSSQNYQPMAR